jgi:outer membrane protein assembly factor BamB
MKSTVIALLAILMISSFSIPLAAADTGSSCAVLIDFGNGQVAWSDVSLSSGMNALDVTELATEELNLEMTVDFGFVSTIDGKGWNASTGEYWNFWTWNSSRAVWDWSWVGPADIDPNDVGAIAWSYAASADPMSFAPPYPPMATPDHRYPWTSFRHDSFNTGSQLYYAPNNLTLRWQIDLANGAIDAPIVVAQGREYVVTGGVLNLTTYNYDTNSSLMCLEEDEVLWTADIGKGYQVGSPLLFSDKVIVPSASGNIYAFVAKNGSKAWSFDTGSGGSYGVVSSPVVYQNQIIVAASNGKVFSLKENGEQNWNMTIAPVVYSSTPSFRDGMIYIGADDGKLHALYANGTKEAWSTQIGGKVRGSPILLENEIVVTYLNSTPATGGLAALGYDGELLWQTATGVNPASATLSSKGFASITSSGAAMIGFDGEKLWEISLGTDFAGAAPAAVNGTFYMVTNEGTSRLLAISDSGLVYSQHALLPAQYALSAPTISDGILYASADNGMVYAYDLNSIVPSQSYSIQQNDLVCHFSTQQVNDTLFYYYWDFGDGNTSTARQVDHTYAIPGTYNIVLRVNSPDGSGIQQVTQITVTAAEPPTSDDMWILMAAALAIVAVVAVAFIMLRRRQGKKA